MNGIRSKEETAPMELSASAERHVRAAEGWLELGNALEANEELERIEARLRGHPEVLAVRWRIFAHAGQWESAVELAGVVMAMLPERRAETLYALAVIACRRRGPNEARRWLAKALELGGGVMKLRALEDAELRDLWNEH